MFVRLKPSPNDVKKRSGRNFFALGIVGLLASYVIGCQQVSAQECKSGERVIKEIELDGSLQDKPGGRRNFEILVCSIRMGVAEVRNYSFQELPRDRVGEYVETELGIIYLSRPVGKLADSAVFFLVYSKLNKPAHGFLVNKSFPARTLDSQMVSTVFLETDNGMGKQVRGEYNQPVDIYNKNEVVEVIIDMIKIATAGDKQ